MRKIIIVACLFLNAAAAHAKDLNDVAADMASLQTSDPKGFILMVVSIGLLGMLVLSLIIMTSIYFVKSKQKKGE